MQHFGGVPVFRIHQILECVGWHTKKQGRCPETGGIDEEPWGSWHTDGQKMWHGEIASRHSVSLGIGQSLAKKSWRVTTQLFFIYEDPWFSRSFILTHTHHYTHRWYGAPWDGHPRNLLGHKALLFVVDPNCWLVPFWGLKDARETMVFWVESSDLEIDFISFLGLLRRFVWVFWTICLRIQQQKAMTPSSAHTFDIVPEIISGTGLSKGQTQEQSNFKASKLWDPLVSRPLQSDDSPFLSWAHVNPKARI